MIELAVKDGQLDTFKTLMGEMVAGTSSETGSLRYESYISDDERTVNVFEKYADSDAMITHVSGFMEKSAAVPGERRSDTFDGVRRSESGRELLAAFGGTLPRPVGRLRPLRAQLELTCERAPAGEGRGAAP